MMMKISKDGSAHVFVINDNYHCHAENVIDAKRKILECISREIDMEIDRMMVWYNKEKV